MRPGSTFLLSVVVLAATLPAVASPRARRGPTSPRLFNKRSASIRPAAAKPVSQRAIDPERTTQIQAALIKHGYMTGDPTGKWDSNTQSALEKMQGDNGWQTKIVPDSRAIIKLGLGPGSGSIAPESPGSQSFSSSPEKGPTAQFLPETDSNLAVQQ